jgi:hypothetical protein
MRFLRDRVVQVCLAVAVVGLLVAVVWSALTPERPDGADVDDVLRTPAAAGTLDLADVGDLSDVVGQRVSATALEVHSVPADEGFWVDTSGEDAWVQLKTAGESPMQVEAGQRVSFVGTVVAHDADFAERPEFSGLDAAQLVDAGAHVEVDIDDIEIVAA